MIQEEVTVDEETYWFLRLLSGYGFWFIMALLLIAVVLYKKFKN